MLVAALSPRVSALVWCADTHSHSLQQWSALRPPQGLAAGYGVAKKPVSDPRGHGGKVGTVPWVTSIGSQVALSCHDLYPPEPLGPQPTPFSRSLSPSPDLAREATS